jgi:hypothetical protein
MMMLRKLLFALLVLGLSSQFLTGCDLYTCQDGKLCVFKHPDFEQRYQWDLNDNDTNYSDNNWIWESGDVEDDTSSVVNNTGAWVALYFDRNYDGWSVCLAPGTTYRDLRNFLGYTLDNEFSSHQWGTADDAPQRPGTICNMTMYPWSDDAETGEDAARRVLGRSSSSLTGR